MSVGLRRRNGSSLRTPYVRRKEPLQQKDGIIKPLLIINPRLITPLAPRPLCLSFVGAMAEWLLPSVRPSLAIAPTDGGRSHSMGRSHCRKEQECPLRTTDYGLRTKEYSTKEYSTTEQWAID